MDMDGLTIDNKFVVRSLGGAFESSVYGVVLQHIGHVLGIDERVVDAYDLRLGIVQGGTQDQMPDSAEAVDSNRRYGNLLLVSQ
jgi:hypothetical protein